MSRGRTNFVEWNGRRVSLRQLAAPVGLNMQTIYSRFRRSGSLDVVQLTRPVDVRYTHRGRWE